MKGLCSPVKGLEVYRAINTRGAYCSWAAAVLVVSTYTRTPNSGIGLGHLRMSWISSPQRQGFANIEGRPFSMLVTDGWR